MKQIVGKTESIWQTVEKPRKSIEHFIPIEKWESNLIVGGNKEYKESIYEPEDKTATWRKATQILNN